MGLQKQRIPPAQPAGPPDRFRSAEQVSEIIGSIYDCALEPAKWRATLANINREFDFLCAALAIIAPRAGMQRIKAEVGFDPEWLAIGESYSAEAVELWGGAERVQQFPLDEPIIASQTPSYHHYSSNRYYVEVLEPRSMVDTAMIALAREPDLIGYVAFNRNESQGLIRDQEVAALRLLAPHFRRAATISNLFDMKEVETASFASVLDNFAFGILLVDENLGVVHANAAAAEMLTRRALIRLDKGRLTLAQHSPHAALERAVRQAAVDAIGLGPKGIGIPARGELGESGVVHVLPLRYGELRRSVTQRAAAALFVTSTAAAAPPLPTDALALLYDLTPAEARVLELLATNMKPAAIGETLGIAPSTVRTHLLHLFEKTGCKRQIDLTRLVAGLSAPI